MSTRSTIAFENEAGIIKSIYCHWDGYPEYNGKILTKNYNNLTLVEFLVSGGDISSLKEEVFSTEYYHRDRGENWDKVEPLQFRSEVDLISRYSTSGCEFFYLFKNGKWTCKDSQGNNVKLEFKNEAEV